MKVAVVTTYPPSKGSLNEYAYHLVEQLEQKPAITELQMIVEKLETENYSTHKNEKLSFFPVWSFNSLLNCFKILSSVRKSKPDVVFYNLQFLSFGDGKIAATFGLLSPMLTKLFGFPSVVLLHNITETVDLESAGITKNPIMKWFYGLSGNIVTRIILQSNIVAVTIGKYVKILEEKYKVKNVALVPHGSFELPPRPDFESGDDELNIMTFGKFGTYKKVELMIEAIAEVREKLNKKIKIVIAGTDNPNVKGYLADVEKKYAHLPDIEYTGYVAEEDVPRLFTESTFVVFDYTSTTGSSGVLHQAGSYGKAVILPNIGDLKELIEEEGYAGEYFEPGDKQGLTQAIEKLILDKEHRVKIATKNYAAAASLPMSDIAEWYLMHFKSLQNN